MRIKESKKLLGLVVAFSLFFQFASTADAGEPFPTKPINLVSPYAVGGGTDLEAWGMVPFMEKYLKVHITIENISGAGGKIAFTKVWKANPDGYTILYHVIPASISNHTC